MKNIIIGLLISFFTLSLHALTQKDMDFAYELCVKALQAGTLKAGENCDEFLPKVETLSFQHVWGVPGKDIYASVSNILDSIQLNLDQMTDSCPDPQLVDKAAQLEAAVEREAPGKRARVKNWFKEKKLKFKTKCGW